jgi:hypothetical protein
MKNTMPPLSPLARKQLLLLLLLLLLSAAATVACKHRWSPTAAHAYVGRSQLFPGGSKHLLQQARSVTGYG